MACERESPQKSNFPIVQYTYTQRRIFYNTKKPVYLSCSALSGMNDSDFSLIGAISPN